MSYPHKWYSVHYYNKWGDNSVEPHSFLKVQDQFAALCYMHGLFPYFTVEEILDVSNLSLMFNKKIVSSINSKNKHIISLQDSIYIKNFNCIDQINMLKTYTFKRLPKNILDIGAGAGLLTIAANYMGYNSIAIEPSVAFKFLLKRHLEKLELINKIHVQHYEFFQNVSSQILSEIDTVIFCAAVEHIPEQYFYPILDKIKKYVKNCYCIIVNTINYWPIPIYQSAIDDHVFYQDNDVYNKIKTYFSQTLYQEGSHLVGIIN